MPLFARASGIYGGLFLPFSTFLRYFTNRMTENRLNDLPVAVAKPLAFSMSAMAVNDMPPSCCINEDTIALALLVLVLAWLLAFMTSAAFALASASKQAVPSFLLPVRHSPICLRFSANAACVRSAIFSRSYCAYYGQYTQCHGVEFGYIGSS